MSDNFALAMIASRRHHVDGTLEAVKDMCFPSEPDFESLVVFVSAMVTFGHKFLLLSYIRFGWIPSLLN
jgi:hypothetical protein